jgi:hypothetical protein
VTGGRSAAETTGRQEEKKLSTQEGCQKKWLRRVGVELRRIFFVRTLAPFGVLTKMSVVFRGSTLRFDDRYFL